jgi:soluble lytic murein transglycosylase-like protein
MGTERDQLIEFYSQRFGIPPSLSQAQMMAESSGNPNAVSAEGARGLFQITPATASDLLFQEEVNIMVSRFYQKFVFDRIAALRPGSISSADRWQMALAAYDAGPGMVYRIRLGAKDPDSIEGIIASLPAETKVYVERIWTAFAKVEKSSG